MGSEWMTNLPDALKNIPLNRLAIPGSHDSGAYDLTTELSPDAPSALQYLSKISCIYPIYKYIVLNMSTCQTLTIGQQLNAGIRHLDLRVSSKAGSSDLFLVHSVYGSMVKDALKEIRDFLDDHQWEVIIMDCQHFYGMDPEHHQTLISLLKSTLGSILYGETALKDATLKNITAAKKQVICIYQDPSADKEKDLWSSGSIQSPWPQTTSPETCVQKLTQYMDRAKSVTDQFFVCQGVVTPDASYVVKHLCGGSVHKLTQKFDPVFFPWLDQSPTNWKHEPNIVIHDFVEEGNYIQQVLDLNKQRTGTPSHDLVQDPS